MINQKNLITLIIPLVIGTSQSWAQVSQGTVRLGPDIGFASSSIGVEGVTEEVKSSQLDLGLGVGVFVANNFEIALGFGVSNAKTEVGSANQTENGFFIGPALTYMVPASGQVYIPISAGFAYNSINSDNGNGEINFTGFSFGGDIGVEYIVNQTIGARFALGASFGTLEDDDIEAEFDINAFQLGIGINFYLGGGKD